MNLTRIQQEYITGSPVPISQTAKEEAIRQQEHRMLVENSQLIQNVLTILRQKLADKAHDLFNTSAEVERFSSNAQLIAHEGYIIKKVINLIENNKYE